MNAARFRRTSAATFAAILALPLVAPAPSRASMESPSPIALSTYPHAIVAGSAMRTIEEADSGALVGGVQIFIAAGLDRQPQNQSGLAALVAESIVRSPETGVLAPPGQSIRDAIAGDGGLLEYTVEGRTVHYYIEGPGNVLPGLIARFGKVLAAPSFTPAIVDASKSALAARAVDLEGSALSVGVAMFRRSYYAGGPGQPVLGTSASLAALTSHDAQVFYSKNYVREAVTASAVGAVDGDVPAALDAVAQALPSGTVSAVVTKTKPISATPSRIVSRRDVGAPQVVVGFAAPSPSSPDFGAMLVIESLLSNAFERAGATSITDPERSVGAAYLYDTTPASIVVYVNGGRVDPSIALRELVLVARSLAHTKLSGDAFSHFQTTAEGTFVTTSMTLSDRSYLLGTLASQGLGPDAINAALASLQKTRSTDVQRVAKRYLQKFVIALVLPRSDSAGDGS